MVEQQYHRSCSPLLDAQDRGHRRVDPRRCHWCHCRHWLFQLSKHEPRDQKGWCWGKSCHSLEPSMEKRMIAIRHLMPVCPADSSLQEIDKKRNESVARSRWWPSDLFVLVLSGQKSTPVVRAMMPVREHTEGEHRAPSAEARIAVARKAAFVRALVPHTGKSSVMLLARLGRCNAT